MLTEIRVKPGSQIHTRVQWPDPKSNGIDFKPGLNLLIGPNGSGKSTLLRGLSEQNKDISVHVSGSIAFSFFDAEKMNPRVSNFIDEGPAGMLSVLGRFKSHGETLGPVITSVFKKPPKESMLVMLDEPEAGLDHNAMSELLTLVKRRVSAKGKFRLQVLVSTHYVPFWLLEGHHVLLGQQDYRDRVLNDYRKLFRENQR